MKLQLDHVDALRFVGRNEHGETVQLNSNSDEGSGASPMELVAMSLAGCSSIDIVMILEKQRQQIERFQVEIEAERAQDQTPAVFETIHLDFQVEGEVDPAKLRRAIDLSLDKYCSVSKMLDQVVDISYGFTVNGEKAR